MGLRVAVFVVTAASLGCTSPEHVDHAEWQARASAELVAVGEPSQGPPASDAVPRRRVAFRLADGSLRPIDRDAIAFVPRWRAAAALVDPERRLYEVHPDGSRKMLAAGATGSLATSEDGALLVYVIARDVLGELRAHDGHEERVLAGGLASAGSLRVDASRVLFVGGAPGGIAGVWTAALDGSGARCLTNCELRTGTDWQADFVPLPASFEPGAHAVAWIDAEGVRHEVEVTR